MKRKTDPAARIVDPTTLVPWGDNPRHNDHAVAKVAASIEAFGFASPIIVRKGTNVVIAGHTRLKAALSLGLTTVPVRFLDLTTTQATQLAVADNRLGELADWDAALVAKVLEGLDEVDVEVVGFSQADLDALDVGADTDAVEDVRGPSLAARFGVPPFSVLDARQGYWRARKAEWMGLGLQSELGRESTTTYNQASLVAFAGPKYQTMTCAVSVFDPVLCELVYRWFTPPGGRVLDPFAGGSVRGVVASALGRHYTGVDLQERQVEANRAQWADIAPSVEGAAPTPEWVVGDSSQALDHVGDSSFDLVFTCPPYGNLEVYSEDPADLSNMAGGDMLRAYGEIVKKALAKLRDDRFAVVVVGDYRGADGMLSNFVSHTIQAFTDAGARLYNEAVLITRIGTLAVRSGAPFTKSRKLGKGHQNVLVFVKGDPRKAAAACGVVDADFSTALAVEGEPV